MTEQTQIDSLRAQICIWEKAHAEKHELEDKIYQGDKVAIAHALELQRSENAIHFEKLNGEAGRLTAMQATYLPRELHEQASKEIMRRLDDTVSKEEHRSLANQVETLKLINANLKGQMFAYSTVIGVVLNIVLFIIGKYL